MSATVNGVTGSAVVVVQQPVAASAPPAVFAGSSFTATTRLPNAGPATLTKVSLSLTTPRGWREAAISPSAFATVGSGRPAQTTWNVTVPGRAKPGTFQLDAQATFQSANGGATAGATAVVAVPYKSLTAAFDNVGVSDDANPLGGNLDGAGLSYSAQALAGTGLGPGARFRHAGLTFVWPKLVPGALDDVIALPCPCE